MTCADLAVSMLPTVQVKDAGLVAFYLPMHTATRLAAPVLKRVRTLNPTAHLCCYGLYAPLNQDYLRSCGVQSILGGEFELQLAQLADSSAALTATSLERLAFLTPDRNQLPVLSRYPKLLLNGRKKRVGYTEASRGCKHLCRHCPVVPVYQGTFRVVQSDVVLADIRQQVAAGAQHITFGDPDFLNGPAHARRIVERLHAEFPSVTYDVTVKVEHLLQQPELLPLLRDTGCLFIISAVESVQDEILSKLDKGHTRADFLKVAELSRVVGIPLAPTLLPFTPWTTMDGFQDLLRTVHELDLVEHVAAIQWSLRLLIPAGSRLLELEEIRQLVGPFDEKRLIYPWKHPDAAIDELGERISAIVRAGVAAKRSRSELFYEVWAAATGDALPENYRLLPRTVIPYMEEPWFC